MATIFMKKMLVVAIASSILLLTKPMYSNDPSIAEYEYHIANKENQSDLPLGSGSSSVANATINISMIGWGLGLAVVIAIVAGVIHQSVASHSDATTEKSG